MDSVHSLPVTSNSSKHNLSKVATSSGGTPQASYADIARMATINMSHNSVLNMSTIVPSMLNTTSWPSVPPKTPSEPDKVPQDYYPSLDELQHPERKAKLQNSNYATSLSLPFDKPLSPTLKMKNVSDRKKAEAQEEAINKNIQVFKYVQDLGKMHECLTQQEQTHLTSSSFVISSNEITTTNPITPKLNSTMTNYNPVDFDNNPNTIINNKDSVTHTRTNNPRPRRSYMHNNQNVQPQGSQEESYIKNVCSYQDETIKKSHNIDTPQPENKIIFAQCDSFDDTEAQKLKTSKTTQESQNIECDNSKIANNDLRSAKVVVKEYHNQNIVIKHDVTKIGICQSQNLKQDSQDSSESKKTKSQIADKDQSQKLSDVHPISGIKNTTPRPAVILLDETSSDIAKNSNLPTELTFGFEINEQLLLSEDSGNDENPVTNPVFSSVASPPNFGKNPPLFEKPMRYEKFSPNYHMQASNAHVMPPVHTVMVQPLPYMSYPARFPPPTYLPPPPPPPPEIMEKYQPKEDFSMLYVAPEEEINVQTYNHDKIVTFVGLGKTTTFFLKLFNR